MNHLECINYLINVPEDKQPVPPSIFDFPEKG